MASNVGSTEPGNIAKRISRPGDNPSGKGSHPGSHSIVKNNNTTGGPSLSSDHYSNFLGKSPGKRTGISTTI